MCMVALSTVGFSQESVNRTELYEDVSSYLLSQFVMVVDSNLSVSDLKNSVELWASSIFNNMDAVKIAEGDNYIVFKPLLTHNYDGGMGIIVEGKITAHTKFEFKQGKIRVTITEQPSRYVSNTGVSNICTWESGGAWKDTYYNKGMWKPAYRQMKSAIQERNEWVDEIKSINFTPMESSDW